MPIGLAAAATGFILLVGNCTIFVLLGTVDTISPDKKNEMIRLLAPISAVALSAFAAWIYEHKHVALSKTKPANYAFVVFSVALFLLVIINIVRIGIVWIAAAL